MVTVPSDKAFSLLVGGNAGCPVSTGIIAKNFLFGNLQPYRDRGMSDIELPAYILLPDDRQPAQRVRRGRMVDPVAKASTYSSS